MKYKILSLLVASASASYATTLITATNAQGANSVPVVDNSGAGVTTATYSVGFISGGALTSLDDFQVVGTGGGFATAAFAQGLFGGFGGSGVSIDLPINPSTATPIGEQIAILIADPTDATKAIVFESSALFVAEDAILGGPAVSINFSDATLLLGETVALADNGLGPGGGLAGATGNGGITFQAIPEPSAALLGLIGLAGLLRRRR